LGEKEKKTAVLLYGSIQVTFNAGGKKKATSKGKGLEEKKRGGLGIRRSPRKEEENGLAIFARMGGLLLSTPAITPACRRSPGSSLKIRHEKERTRKTFPGKKGKSKGTWLNCQREKDTGKETTLQSPHHEG